jgi:hypothetical protein
MGKRVTVEKAEDVADGAAAEVGRALSTYQRREAGVRKKWDEKMKAVEERMEERLKEVEGGHANGYANGHVDGHSNGNAHVHLHPSGLGLGHYSNLLSFLTSYVPRAGASTSSPTNTNINTYGMASTSSPSTSSSGGVDPHRRSLRSTLRRLVLETIPKDGVAPLSPPQASYSARPFASQS